MQEPAKEDLIFQQYQKVLKDQNQIDFNDILNEAVKILKKHPNVMEKLSQIYKFSKRFKFNILVLVDEFQDLSLVQYYMLEQIFTYNKRITIIGDINQSIYGFRGGTPLVFKKVEELCNKSKVFLKKVHLKYNYRSTKLIIQSFEHLISKNNTSGKDIKTLTRNDEGELVNIIYYSTLKDIQDYIVKSIKHSKVPLNDICILSRKKKNLSEFKSFLTKNQIPSFNNTFKSIIDQIISYFTIIMDCKGDSKEFWEIINVPKRSLSLAFQNYFNQFKHENNDFNISNYKVCEKIVRKDFPDLKRKDIKINKKQKEGLTLFVKLIEDLRKDLKKYTLDEFIDYTYNHLQLQTHLIKEQESQEKSKKYNHDSDSEDEEVEDVEEKLQNLKNLSKSFFSQNNYSSNEKMSQSLLEEFVNFTKICQSKQENLRDEGQKVVISTIHAQKGLEYDTVYIVNVEDGICPIYPDKEWSNETKQEFLCEERRILFVGMSRAKNHLHIFVKKGTFSKELEGIPKKNVIVLNPPKTNEKKVVNQTPSLVNQNISKNVVTKPIQKQKVIPPRIPPKFKLSNVNIEKPKPVLELSKEEFENFHSQETEIVSKTQSQSFHSQSNFSIKKEEDIEEIEGFHSQEKENQPEIDQEPEFSSQTFSTIEYIERTVDVKVEKTKSIQIKEENTRNGIVKPIRKIEDVIFEISDDETEPKKVKR